ncbi:DUF4192 domain-containing protein [Actinoplanes sp. RD1]|uniref:DUF4192 domain-containing protein n=1 Tax=Actinoplanes sp. RD1 TaxID=3064538 RepID=UPI0027404F1E|nr:DUF4192 domain-containing protein [Actinoplanes sp. RD1]
MAVRSRAEVLGLVPYLLGYHPKESVVAIFLDAVQDVACVSRLDLTAPAAVAVHEWSRVSAQQPAGAVLLIGYGPRDAGAQVTVVADGLAAHAPVVEVLLVTEGRFFCLRCPCGDASGVVFDPAATAVAARATLAGRVALGSRDQLIALTAADPLEQIRLSAVLAQPSAGADEPGPVLAYGLEVAADGQRLPDEQAAQLLRLLRHRTVRDLAWEATGDLMWQRDLWLDLTRRAPAGHIAAPASLAAWCAWQRGEHTLASAAVDRALADDPGYLIAQLLDHALRHGLRPQQLFPHLAPDGGVATAGDPR